MYPVSSLVFDGYASCFSSFFFSKSYHENMAPSCSFQFFVFVAHNFFCCFSRASVPFLLPFVSQSRSFVLSTDYCYPFHSALDDD